MGLGKMLGLTTDDGPKIIKAPEVVKPMKQTQTPVIPSGKSRRSSANSDTDAENTDTEVETKEVSGGSVDDKFEKALRSAVASTSSDKFDYVKFVKVLNSNKKGDEDSKYQTALATADAMGVSSEDLLDSVKNVMKVLNSEKREFESSVAQRKSDNDTDKEDLKKIDTQIASLQAKKKSLEGKVSTNDEAIEEDEKNFEATYEKVSGEVSKVSNNIKSYSK